MRIIIDVLQMFAALGIKRFALSIKNKPGASGGGPTKLRDLSTSYGILNDFISSKGMSYLPV
jgi:hypothetical protein